jgi:coenzyme F420-reducing hydrogenase alpha subunit
MNEAINLEEGRLMSVNVIVTMKNNQPAIELRALTTNQHLIKNIISSVWHNKPVIVFPVVSKSTNLINSCLDKGILYLDPNDNKYYFTF